ncbi:MAG: glutathione S-transferase family protein [Psychrobacter sp.]|nr:glutathione S-transferase family protein [Psychrobacter sp.]
MQKPVLIIGNKNYSSWSLRAWLLLKAFDIKFDEQSIELFAESALPTLNAHSPTLKVPVLIDNEKVTVWDTLAIAIYANDYLTEMDIWSGVSKIDIENTSLKLKSKRAHCQSIVAEMHSGLSGIRNEMPMNIRAIARIEPSAACLKDIARIEQIFAECLANKPLDSYLFGHFTVADAFYAPVVLRLQTYAEASGIDLKPTTKQYCQTMLNNPHIQQWRDHALQETRIIDEDEAGEICSIVGVLAE